MQKFCLAFSMLFLATAVGCEAQSAPATPPQAPAKPVAVDKLPATNVAFAEQPPQQDESDNGVLSAAAALLQKARESGATNATDAAKWVQQQASGGAQVAEDSAAWVGDMFQSLKSRGLTTADNVSDWVTDDFKSMGGWEYKIVEGLPDEEKMNELGGSRWECFHVAPPTLAHGPMVFFYKRQKRSYLRNIPMKDLLKLMPLMSNGGEE